MDKAVQIRKISDLEIIKLDKIIGKGCFGEVREGLMNEEKVAIKSFKNQTTVNKDEAEKELMVMAQLKHKNIVNFIGIIDEFQKCPQLVFEFVENGALKDFVSVKSRDEETLIRLSYDISCGMSYLHDMQYIHRDLSARNVLVDSRERAKVADFGMCKFLDLDNSPENYYYTVDAAKPCPLRWVPKEIIQVVTSRGALEGKFTFASDVWAFGVTMWEMWMNGAVPYMWLGRTMSNQDVCINIANGKNPNSFDKPKNISAKILQIMDQTFQVDRKQRPKFSQLKVQLEMIIEERKEAQLTGSTLEESKIDDENIGVEKREYILLEDAETGRLLNINSSVSLAKWWPAKKNLILAMHLRRVGKQLLVEKLHEIIFSNRRRMVVICQCETATKFSGLGGVGKTLTAKWYAHHFEKEYENIIWIDCGEDSLLQSFRNLAIDLDIPNRGEFNDAHDLARHCFKSLCDQKCLWIFDNVESYMGSEGIHAVLPSNPEKFCCLITSRSKENWGNDTGFGEIGTFELSVFNENESIEFLRNYLKKEAKGNDYQLKQMSELLGNLPLALQLAVATLNKGTMQLQDYIDRTSTKDAGNIINEKFDDYEKTINKNMQISLEMLKKEVHGNIAHEILMIFGYIRPDNVLSEFLRKVTNVSFQDFQKAVDVLEKYCLVTKSGKQKMVLMDGFLDKLLLQRKEMEVNLLSIHRLLQQVIRHNGKSTEKATIRKILNCNGFLDYKLVPFLFADEDLKMEFKKLKVKLSDQLYLEKLFAKKEFSQCIVVSRFIHQEVNNDAALYNYALCLDRKGEVDESLKQFKQILAKINPLNTESSSDNVFQLGLIPLDSQPNYFNIIFHFLHLIQSKKNALDFHELEICQKFGKELILKFTLENMHGIFESLENCPMTHYFVRIKEDTILIKFKPRGLFASEPKKLFIDVPQSIHFILCSLVENIRLPMNLVELKLSKVRFTDKNGKELYNLKLSNFIPQNVQIFAIGFCHFTIPWNAFAHVRNFYARECYIRFPYMPVPVSECITPQKLKLRCINFWSDGKKLKELRLNEIFDFRNIEELCILQRHEDTLLSLDFTKFASAKNVELVQAKIVNWGRWRVQRLSLQGVPFIQKNQMQITEMECSYSTVDLSCVSNSIEKLQISSSRVVNLCGGKIELPNLAALYLLDVKVPRTCLSHFDNCKNLAKLKLRYSYKIKFPTKAIPISVTDIEIQAGHPIQSFELEDDCVRELNTLVLEYIGFRHIIQILKTLRPKHLLVHSMPHVINESQLTGLFDSLETKIVTVLIRDTVDYYFKNGIRKEITVDQFTTTKNMHFS